MNQRFLVQIQAKEVKENRKVKKEFFINNGLD
jgi:hypothetical protein